MSLYVLCIVRSEILGTITAVTAVFGKNGGKVEPGQVVLVVEATKMECELRAAVES